MYFVFLEHLFFFTWNRNKHRLIKRDWRTDCIRSLQALSFSFTMADNKAPFRMYTRNFLLYCANSPACFEGPKGLSDILEDHPELQRKPDFRYFRKPQHPGHKMKGRDLQSIADSLPQIRQKQIMATQALTTKKWYTSQPERPFLSLRTWYQQMCYSLSLRI